MKEDKMKNSDELSGEAKSLECARAALEKKAEHLKVLDLTQISAFTNYFVLCNGNSERQVQAISDSIKKNLEQQGVMLLAREGYPEGRWILMDYGEVMVHIFINALREYYDIDTLWLKAPQIKIPNHFYIPGEEHLN